MKVTRAYLKEVVAQETQILLTEQHLYRMIDEEARKLGIVLTEEQKKGILQRLGKKARQYGAAAALGMGVAAGGAALHGAQSDYEQGVRDQISQNVAAAEEYKSSYEGKLAPLQKQLDNTAGFLWTMSDDPGDTTMLPLTDGGAGILPPDWSVMKKVYDDFVSGAGPLITPDQVVQASGDSEHSRTNFLQDFENTEYEGWGGDPRTGVSGTVYIDFDDLPEDYTLPLSGDSPTEHYVQLWDKYIGY